MSPRQPQTDLDSLAPRERQVLDLLFALGNATAVEIQAGLKDAPTNSTVRKMLSRLEAKGLVTYRRDGARFIYRPTVQRSRARQKALSRLIRVFFDGSASKAALTALQDVDSLSEEELDELEEIVRKARRKG